MRSRWTQVVAGWGAVQLSLPLPLLAQGVAAEPPPQAGAPTPAAAAPAAAAPAPPVYSATQLEDLVSPIALYPDSLVAQILMGSTYPLEIVQADRWRQGHKDLKEDALATALDGQGWDPSVEALTYFPDLLGRMSKNLEWTQEIGNAFLAQQTDVLAAVQRMRKKAYEAGTLQSGPQQTVTVEPSTAAPQEQVIKVEPAQPQTVYVPTYPPTAYGSSYAPAGYGSSMYPPPAAYPPGYNTTTNLLSFGVGMALGGLIWGGGGDDDDDDIDWNGGNVSRNVDIETGDITVNRGNSVNRGNVKREQWKHNPEHRRGVGYPDAKTKQRYAKGTQPKVDQQQARGYDRARDDRAADARAPQGRGSA